MHWRFDPPFKLRMHRDATREVWLHHDKLDLIAKSGLLVADAIALNLTDSERALVWIDGRSEGVLKPGTYVLWTVDRDVRVEVVSTRDVQLVHDDLAAIVRGPNAEALLHVAVVEPGFVAIVFHDGADKGASCRRARTRSGKAPVSCA